jgi:hypothetical protein
MFKDGLLKRILETLPHVFFTVLLHAGFMTIHWKIYNFITKAGIQIEKLDNASQSEKAKQIGW